MEKQVWGELCLANCARSKKDGVRHVLILTRDALTKHMNTSNIDELLT